MDQCVKRQVLMDQCVERYTQVRVGIVCTEVSVGCLSVWLFVNLLIVSSPTTDLAPKQYNISLKSSPLGQNGGKITFMKVYFAEECNVPLCVIDEIFG